jgi:hypothetical protein
VPVDTSWFSDGQDPELLDPDGVTDALGFTTLSAVELAAGAPADRNEHGAGGDGRTARQEYRGYILDGGGHDWGGGNAHAGGHARLSPVYKDFLVEVDPMTGTTHLPDEAGIRDWMDDVAAGMSQAVDGAGLRMWYILQDLGTPHDTFVPGAIPQPDAVRAYVTANIHPRLTSFKHLHLVDEFDGQGTSGWSWNDVGSTYAVDRGHGFAAGAGIAFGISSPSYISHELHHTIIAQPGDDGGEHFDDTNGNGVPLEADDQARVLWNYNNPGYAADDMRAIRYGLGTTRFIEVR